MKRLNAYLDRIALTGISLLLAGPVSAEGLENLAQKLETFGMTMAKAVLVAAFVIAGGAIAMGSDNSGKWAGRAFLAAIFLALAMAGAAAIKAWIASTTGVVNG